jgi:hypothetical protein
MVSMADQYTEADYQVLRGQAMNRSNDPDYQLCKSCGQPMKPKGVKKRPDEFDHAQGCPYTRKLAASPSDGAAD